MFGTAGRKPATSGRPDVGELSHRLQVQRVDLELAVDQSVGIGPELARILRRAIPETDGSPSSATGPQGMDLTA